MIIFKQAAEISRYLLSKGRNHLTTGFVPTMGALHEGHIELVKKACRQNDLMIASIFVNPAQFNNPIDFAKYPNTIEKDIALLEKSGCDILFLPSVNEIYPDGYNSSIHYDLGLLETQLEGRFRPGHFQGVCKVVQRLLDIVKPTTLYLGQKDFQQCMVIKKLIEITGIKTHLIICPTKREADGLAMSSRNLRLTTEERKRASSIYEELKNIKKNINKTEIAVLKDSAKQTLVAKGFKVDYIEIAKTSNLQIIETYNNDQDLVVLAAAYLNDVRLIDNMPLTQINKEDLV